MYTHTHIRACRFLVGAQLVSQSVSALGTIRSELNMGLFTFQTLRISCRSVFAGREPELMGSPGSTCCTALVAVCLEDEHDRVEDRRWDEGG
jgi:hypothetical protein